MEAESSSISNHQSPPPEAVNSRPWTQIVVRRESQPDTNTSSFPSGPSPTAMKEPHSGSSPKPAPPSHSGSSPKAATSFAPPAPDNNHAAAGSTDSNCNNVGGSPERQAWMKPSNGVLDVNPLEGVSWPALSEAAKPSKKSSVESSSRTVSNGSASTSQRPINLNPHQKNRTTSGTASRSRHPKRSGYGGSSSGGASIQRGIRPPTPLPHSPPAFPSGQKPHRPQFNGYRPMLQNHHSLQYSQYSTVGGFIPQPSMMNGFGGMGSYRRGNGIFQNNFGMRDQDCGNYENDGDAQIQPRGLVGPPPPPFSPLMRPNIFPTRIPMEPYGGVPYFGQLQPVSMHLAEPNICGDLMLQIEYYFSDDNLVKDRFLKGKMDDKGWVPVSLIAGFPKVQKMTNDIQLILNSLRISNIVEVQDDKLRRRDEWMKWVSSSSRVSSPDSGSSSQVGSSLANLAASLHNTTLEDKADNPPQEEPSSGHSS